MKVYILEKFLEASLAAYVLLNLTGCMQLTGLQEFDAWGFKGKANTGFEVSAGVQQYDHVLDRKGINIEALDSKRKEAY
jgi:hypothetical protein